jgi:hypothetical protein
MAFIAAKMMAFGGVLRGGMWTKSGFLVLITKIERRGQTRLWKLRIDSHWSNHLNNTLRSMRSAGGRGENDMLENVRVFAISTKVRGHTRR